jgi:hypothetical protein
MGISDTFMRNISDHTWQWPLRPEKKSKINIPFAPVRHRAFAMEFSVDLDGQYVEMNILTDTHKTITVVCDKDSIFAIQKHIEQITCACPEIATWKPARSADNFHGNDRRSYEAAMWEGWPVSRQDLFHGS